MAGVGLPRVFRCCYKPPQFAVVQSTSASARRVRLEKHVASRWIGDRSPHLAAHLRALAVSLFHSLSPPRSLSGAFP